MRQSKALVLVFTCVMALGLVGVAGCVGGKTDTGDGYEISNQALTKGENDLDYLHAVVKNTCGRTETLLMGWDLFDKDGNKIGTALGGAEELPDGETAEVEAIVMPDDSDMIGEMSEHVASFELSGVYFMKEENARLEAKNEELRQEQEREKMIDEILNDRD